MIQTIKHFIDNINALGFSTLVLVLGILEFSFGLYKRKWPKNERWVDIACFTLPKFVIRPLVAYYTLTFLPWAFADLKNVFGWVPFFWGVIIIAIADDLTQYWYHRLHHEIPWLWRFHRTHHSASYMGMAMASRQNAIYTLFFSQTYLTAALVYLGLGAPAIVVKGIKSTITTLAHSSIPWDKPFYKYKALHPLAWILERTISTPATHHAHHAATTDDGVGYYKGNFGNMFFFWDIIFGTALISRQYPKAYGISHYEGDPWHAQLLWPIFKSPVKGSELAADGLMVRADVPLQPHQYNDKRYHDVGFTQTNGEPVLQTVNAGA
ncbi:sterol desaturase/sphingolipid hydroxylase (fatty acid hydroxylase superfamily) [Mucilaginibacter yixingensis]|uniref:Sterol desaturase/sphingolipid hydroxylase (Fatty acid hydroxylase superfamily) n=1 Tax=Mucilaginibacter yixingensis TaxID=1295612 RepID=A0A2T5JGA2_9SPHI|nr:sterol desaturase family protein [Mucilaginibacter yixingensis]PTR01467.1 sterol desaturase/sphingolipid hydroxylase (fatty acid hydroxylase superfamily) [Mucilaginibacter yixingensis]